MKVTINKLKKNVGCIACTSFLISFTSIIIGCSDYLEAPPTVDLDEDKVFQSRVLTEQFLSGIYAEGMPLGFNASTKDNGDRRLGSSSTLGSACDEAEDGASWGKGNTAWNVDNHTNNSIDYDEDSRYKQRWSVLRRCNTLIERIDEVPVDEGDPEFNTRAKGEAYFMRAIVFWEDVYRYGGMPILKNRLNASDFTRLPRNTFEECINAILEDLDMAASLLPDRYADQTKLGRVTRIAALALKSRVLLYAASPLFNTDTPYISFDDPANNTLICYGNYDKERWKIAADATKYALDEALKAGYALNYDFDGEEIGPYEHVWSTPDNCEIILANKKYRSLKPSDALLSAMLPIEWATKSWWSDGGLFATFNFVKFYEDKQGKVVQWSETGGNDLMTKYENMDPRFDQTIARQGCIWNEVIGEYDCTPGGKMDVSRDKTRHMVRKWIPRRLSVVEPTNRIDMDWIVIRLAELYLNYAEALNEYYDGPTQAAYDAVATVRERSEMPPFDAGLSQDQFRQRLRKERGVELAFEDHRFWDIRRWMIAEEEGVMQGDFYGLKLKSLNSDNTRVSYTPYVFEKRSWSRHSYLHPIKQNEVDKGYLIQNPGW